MPLSTDNLNLWSVLIGAAVYWIIGALWYTVLFSKAWIRAYGLAEEDIRTMQEKQNPAVVFPAMFVCNLMTGLVFAMLVRSLGVTSAGAGALLGGLLWLGFGGACALTTQLGALRPMRGFVIDGGYHLVALAVMGAILGAWQ